MKSIFDDIFDEIFHDDNDDILCNIDERGGGGDDKSIYYNEGGDDDEGYNDVYNDVLNNEGGGDIDDTCYMKNNDICYMNTDVYDKNYDGD